MKIRTRARRSSAGFTLAEMMVVIVIIGLLVTLVVPSVMQKLTTAMKGKVRADITVISNALDEYAMNNAGRYPDSLEDLVTTDENGQTYLKRRTVPLDPWNNEYLYDPPGGGEARPRVYSLGRDGAVGGEGDDADIDNWMIQDQTDRKRN